MSAEQISKLKKWMFVFVGILLLLMYCKSDLKIGISGFWKVKCICFMWFSMIFTSLYNVLDYFSVFGLSFDAFATMVRGFACDLMRIDQIRRIFNVFVDFRPIPPVSGPGRTPGGARAGPGLRARGGPRGLGGVRAGPGLRLNPC